MFTNKSLLRPKFRNNNLVFEDYVFGVQTNTNVSLAYLQGIVNTRILREVKRRLGKIDIDSILESGYIEELIEDNPKSLFATISNTQKPDTVAGKMLEGRVAILTDGTPHVLVIPRLLIEGVMTSEDYYLRPYYASFLRALRFMSIFVTVYLPGLFVALQLYHQEMIPTALLISMSGAREGVPFPVIIETFLREINLGAISIGISHIEIIIIAIINPKLECQDNLNKIFLKSLIYPVIVSTLMTIAAQLTLGIEFAKHTNFPFLTYTRLMRLGQNIQGFDSIYIIAWTMGNAIKIAGYLYIITKILGEIFQRENQNFIIPISILGLLAVLLLKDRRPVLAVKEPIQKYMFISALLLIVIIPIIILIVYLFRRWQLRE